MPHPPYPSVSRARLFRSAAVFAEWFRCLLYSFAAPRAENDILQFSQATSFTYVLSRSFARAKGRAMWPAQPTFVCPPPLVPCSRFYSTSTDRVPRMHFYACHLVTRLRSVAHDAIVDGAAAPTLGGKETSVFVRGSAISLGNQNHPPTLQETQKATAASVLRCLCCDPRKSPLHIQQPAHHPGLCIVTLRPSFEGSCFVRAKRVVVGWEVSPSCPLSASSSKRVNEIPCFSCPPRPLLYEFLVNAVTTKPWFF